MTQSVYSLNVKYKLRIIVLFAVLRHKEQYLLRANDDVLLLPEKPIGARLVWNRQPTFQTALYTIHSVTSNKTLQQRTLSLQ